MERFSGSKSESQIVEITFASCGKSFCKSWKSRLQVVENLLKEMIKPENFRLRRSLQGVKIYSRRQKYHWYDAYEAPQAKILLI